MIKTTGISKRDVKSLNEHLAKLGLAFGMTFDESVWTDRA
jgi:hypothetical protein